MRGCIYFLGRYNGAMRKTPKQRAIEAAGSVAALAGILGITRQAIEKWTRIPAEQAYKIEKATGIRCHELRPDVFPAPEAR